MELKGRVIFGKKNKAAKSATGGLIEGGLVGAAKSGIGKTYNGIANVTGRTAANVANLKNHGIKHVSKHHVKNVVSKLKEKFKNRKCKTGSCENQGEPVAKSEFKNKNQKDK